MFASLTYYTSDQLDMNQWQHCLQSSGDGYRYGDPDYLTQLSAHWGALVWNNYEAVLPICYRKKAGISYIYQPAFIQQQKIYSAKAITSLQELKLYQEALEFLRKKFRFAEFALNQPVNGINCDPRNNYLLALNQDYRQLSTAYKTDLIKNLRTATSYDLDYGNELSAEELVRIFQQLYEAKLSYQQADYLSLSSFLKLPNSDHKFICRTVILKGELMAGCICLKDEFRLYLIVNLTTKAGRATSANHFLLDQLIREYAGKLSWFDFEGSDNAGIAHYYQNFGSILQPYYFVAWNRLSWPLKLLKPAY